MLVFTNYPLRTLRDYYQYKKGLHNGDLFCIGDTNATNFELLLSPEYYKPTMETYILVENFIQNNIQYQTITNA